ncbi:helix-turn-helix transcriptional regulator [Aquaspirillum soli]
MSSHDTLVRRLSEMLFKLNQGERLDPAALAEEFGVNIRTIQRDLNERFAYLPLEKHDRLYALEPSYLGRLTFHDINRFASLSGLAGLFPQIDQHFLRELFDHRMQEAMLIHGHSYEDLSQQWELFKQLQQAIVQHRQVTFIYQKTEGEKEVTVKPYKLINHTGIWYLAAVDQDKVKSYSVAKIQKLFVSQHTFPPDQTILDMLQHEDSIWLNKQKTEVILKISVKAAHYFRRRKLIAGQVIEKELEDGGLLVSGRFAHPNQILPIVRYWIPNVTIVSPEAWQQDMEQELRDYLKQ